MHVSHAVHACHARHDHVCDYTCVSSVYSRVSSMIMIMDAIASITLYLVIKGVQICTHVVS